MGKFTLKDGVGWMLFKNDGKQFVAHKASARPAGTPFVPLFKTRRDAIEYRDLRLEMPHLVPMKMALAVTSPSAPSGEARG